MSIFNRFAVAIISLPLSLLGTGAFASGPTGTKTFQGELFIEAANNTCISLNDAAVGDFYRVVYLYQGSSSHTEGLSLVGSREAYLIQPPSGSLNGSVGITGTGISGHATIYTQSGSSNLTIASVGGLSTADAINLKIVGTINDLYDPGCNVTIHANLVARPN